MSDYKRYYLNEDMNTAEKVTVSGEQFKHMTSVIRHCVGDVVILVNGDGYDYHAEIVNIDKKSAILKLTDRIYNGNRTAVSLIMLCGALKGDGNYEQSVKLSELGASEFVPFISSFTVSKNVNEDRLSRLALESFKQCRRAFPLKTHSIQDFKAAVCAYEDADIKLIAYERCENLSIKQALSNAVNGAASKAITGVNSLDKTADKENRAGLRVVIVIGSEGGFSESEADYAAEHGYMPVSLGRMILRADTAAVAAAAAALCQLGEWDT